MGEDTLSEVKSTLDSVLASAVEGGASDVHLNVGEPYLFRIGRDITHCQYCCSGQYDDYSNERFC